MKENIIKLAISAGIGAFLSYFEILVLPLTILIGLMIVDYGTGIAKAYVNSEISSRTGIIGILKKLGYILIVIVGMSADYLITTAGLAIGIDIPASFTIGLLVIIWLILNELISILENVVILGAPVPSFLITIISKLKVSAESQLTVDDEE